MDRCTHEVRALYWKGIIQKCQQRPDGQSAKSWLKENGILEQSYYKWQQKFRKEAYDLIQVQKQKAVAVLDHNVSFAEIPVKPHKKDYITDVSIAPAAVIKTPSLTIAVSNEISADLLSRIMKEVSAYA